MLFINKDEIDLMKRLGVYQLMCNDCNAENQVEHSGILVADQKII